MAKRHIITPADQAVILAMLAAKEIDLATGTDFHDRRKTLVWCIGREVFSARIRHSNGQVVSHDFGTFDDAVAVYNDW